MHREDSYSNAKKDFIPSLSLFLLSFLVGQHWKLSVRERGEMLQDERLIRLWKNLNI